MIPALSISEFKRKVKKKYSRKNAIIGIMMGRYNVNKIQKPIDESYTYWNYASDKLFDIYWAGYGEYWGDRTSSQFILESAEENNGAYFDIKKFVEFKNYLEEKHNIQYDDTFQLILCNVRDGEIFFNENIILELEDHYSSSTMNIRFIMENIIKLCKYEYSIDSMENTQKFRDFKMEIEKKQSDKSPQNIYNGCQINNAFNNARIDANYNK